VSSQPPRCPLLLVFYEQYLESHDSSNFVRLVAESYGPGTLERLVQSPAREIRRAAVLALGFLGDYDVNHTLGRAMHDEDRTVRTLAENAIRSVWNRMGEQPERQELGVILRMNAARQYQEVIYRTTQLLGRVAWFAEVWHQRAVAYFNLDQYAEAIRDCHESLEINPYHFVAATTMGQAYLELDNPVSALECFRRALRLNPDLEGVRAQEAKLARRIGDNTLD
jgi:tetratricopeptide (TPR) repeat protein